MIIHIKTKILRASGRTLSNKCKALSLKPSTAKKKELSLVARTSNPSTQLRQEDLQFKAVWPA
jgi:hypothetical protein